jgi:hypothetical protein
MRFYKRYLLIIGVIAAVAILLRVFLQIPVWFTFAALLIGWPLVGTLVTLDDDFPGGWSNPDGKSVPEWKRLWWWADLFLVRGSLVVVAYTIEEAVTGRLFFVAIVSALAMAAFGVPLRQKGVREVEAHAG